MKICLDCGKEIKNRNYCGKCATKRWRLNNPGRMEKLCSEHYKIHRDKYIERASKFNKENPDIANARSRKYNKNHPTKSMDRYYTDIQYRIIKIQRARIRAALKDLNKSQTTKELLGCSIDYLKKYLESKFQPGMTWENYSRTGWHVDHIVPISSFNLLDSVQLKQVCHYTNLQPLWAIDNLKKSNKLPPLSKINLTMP